jgi:16S rRNA A1518/A1519 N6-dimethyltransferase RsmA/KsgA/DIM1 with predicted DNA glycosylase/AP lyase activity
MNPHEGYRQDLLAAIESLDPRSLLDVGCGDGRLLREMLDRGRTCVGVEIEE